jgi:hypothetical protein
MTELILASGSTEREGYNETDLLAVEKQTDTHSKPGLHRSGVK